MRLNDLTMLAERALGVAVDNMNIQALEQRDELLARISALESQNTRLRSALKGVYFEQKVMQSNGLFFSALTCYDEELVERAVTRMHHDARYYSSSSFHNQYSLTVWKDGEIVASCESAPA